MQGNALYQSGLNQLPFCAATSLQSNPVGRLRRTTEQEFEPSYTLASDGEAREI